MHARGPVVRFAIAASAAMILAPSPAALASGPPTGKYRTTIRSGEEKGIWTFTFAKSGAYTVKGNFPGLVHGKAKYSGTRITFDHEKNGTQQTCGTAPGKYRFTITGKKLKFTKISDTCDGRRSVLSHTLTRLG